MHSHFKHDPNLLFLSEALSMPNLKELAARSNTLVAQLVTGVARLGEEGLNNRHVNVLVWLSVYGGNPMLETLARNQFTRMPRPFQEYAFESLLKTAQLDVESAAQLAAVRSLLYFEAQGPLGSRVVAALRELIAQPPHLQEVISKACSENQFGSDALHYRNLLKVG
jgi:hypothetical protein